MRIPQKWVLALQFAVRIARKRWMKTSFAANRLPRRQKDARL
jgi:hypothetical protein